MDLKAYDKEAARPCAIETNLKNFAFGVIGFAVPVRDSKE